MSPLALLQRSHISHHHLRTARKSHQFDMPHLRWLHERERNGGKRKTSVLYSCFSLSDHSSVSNKLAIILFSYPPRPLAPPPRPSPFPISQLVAAAPNSVFTAEEKILGKERERERQREREMKRNQRREISLEQTSRTRNEQVCFTFIHPIISGYGEKEREREREKRHPLC